MSEYEGTYSANLGVSTGTYSTIRSAETLSPMSGVLPYITATPAQTYKMYEPPKPVGYWILDPGSTRSFTQFPMFAKVTDEQIKNTETLLGWGWKDYE